MLRTLSSRPATVSAAVFAAAAACFFLPFLTVAEERRASPTGIDLAAGTTEFAGRYVHAAYEGEVEQLVANGRVQALLALTFAAAGFALAFVPRRMALKLALAAAAAGLVAMLALALATMPVVGPESDRRYGFWLVVCLFLVGGAWNAVRLSREREVREPEPAWLREDRPT